MYINKFIYFHTFYIVLFNKINKVLIQIVEELKILFAYVERFKPQDINIGTSLKPFYPQYMPALGSVDEFIKVSRPDGEFNKLGLKVGYFICFILSTFTNNDYQKNIKDIWYLKANYILSKN